MRIEKDSLGSLTLEDDCLYGIHTKRAVENFYLNEQTTNIKLIQAMVMVKKAAAKANYESELLSEERYNAINFACDEVLKNKYLDSFVTNPLQGGAGTSTNMNVNEVIANIALHHLNKPLGSYEIIHPLNHVNCSQSTNDVYPTSLRIAAIFLLRDVSQAFADLQESLQQKEAEFEEVIKLGRTQLMDALPVMLGQEFSCYAQSIARDRWRLYKVEERLRFINLGGTAVGTGMNAERQYVFKVTENIRDITKLGLARAETMMDVTQNNDVFVEVSGLLKSAAVNLIKIANDLRLMASGPKGGFGEINLAPMQAGSSIMPYKVNPVMPEMVTQVAMKVIANDAAITQAVSAGQLELNPFMPLIADSLLNSLELLLRGVTLFREKCIETITANEAICKKHLEHSTALATALIHHVGYDKAADIAKQAHESGRRIFDVAKKETDLSDEELVSILDPYMITKMGIPK